MYLLYMVYAGFGLAYDNQSYNEFFGPASWVFVWVIIDINNNEQLLNWQQCSSKGSYFNMQLRWHRSFSYLSQRWWCLSWWWVRLCLFLFRPVFVRKTDAVLSHFRSGCLSVWLADCLCFGVFGHCAAVQSIRKLVESDWWDYQFRCRSRRQCKSDTNTSSQCLRWLTRMCFSFCDILSRLLRCLHIFLRLLKPVLLVLLQMRVV